MPNLKVDKTFPADDELDATNPVYGPYTYTFDSHHQVHEACGEQEGQ